MGLRTAEAAARLGVGQDRVRNLIEAGKLVGYKEIVPGRSPLQPILMVTEESVEAYIAARAAGEGESGVFVRWRVPQAVRERMREEGYVTSTMAAAIIGVSQDYISRAIRSGRLPGKVEGVPWMHRDDVLRIKAERDARLEAALAEVIG